VAFWDAIQLRELLYLPSAACLACLQLGVALLFYYYYCLDTNLVGESFRYERNPHLSMFYLIWFFYSLLINEISGSELLFRT
jgi:hypothetical protein